MAGRGFFLGFSVGVWVAPRKLGVFVLFGARFVVFACTLGDRLRNEEFLRFSGVASRFAAIFAKDLCVESSQNLLVFIRWE